MMNKKSELITNVAYTVLGDVVKLVVGVKERSRYAVLDMNGVKIPEAYNYKEPFDLCTHVFFFSVDLLGFGLHYIDFVRYKAQKNEWFEADETNGRCDFILNETDFKNYDECVNEQDSKIIISDAPSEIKILEGRVKYSRYDVSNKYKEPIVFFVLEVDPAYASFITGTPNDDYVSGGVKQTVRDEAILATRNGANVVAATNADFFDIFGDLRPAGLCIKNRVVVDNPQSDRPFLGVTAKGDFVITTLKDSPQMISECTQAVSGGQIVLKNGEISDICVLEPFGHIKHPRTAAGITPDGRLVIVVVDGRISEYSNGATLYDIVNILRYFNVEVGINLDGGGSSTMLLKSGDEQFEIKNIPADLERPYDRLIRDLYDSILVVAK